MKLDPRKALVVFSGGQDSTTCLGGALATYEEVQCVTFNYGQRHAIEIEAAERVIGFFEDATGRTIPHEVIQIGDIFAGMSPLTNKSENLETYENHQVMEEVIGDRIEKTFVPMRNAVFLMLAANRAAVAGAGVLMTGVCEADNANYPDCRGSFIAATELAMNEALGIDFLVSTPLLIGTPLMRRSKAESIKLALTLPFTYAALAYSHTAYDGKYPPTGKDHASVLRAHGFEEAGVPDPLVVRAWQEADMDLPETANYNVLREGALPLPSYLVELFDLMNTYGNRG